MFTHKFSGCAAALALAFVASAAAADGPSLGKPISAAELPNRDGFIVRFPDKI